MPDEPETGGTTTAPPVESAAPVPAPEPDINITAELLAAREAANHRSAELAAYRAAVAAGGDADALLDSRSFVREVRELDPSDTAFAEKVKAIIETRQGITSMTEPTTPETGTATTTTIEPTAPQTDPTPDKGDGKDWQAEAEKWKHFSRQHEETSKATKSQLDQQAKVLALLAEKAGVDIDEGGKPDPDKLAAELGKAKDSARQRAVELAVYRAAAKHEADADALLDSRGFANAVAGLDPDAADFGEKVAEAIQTAVEANERYKLKPTTSAEAEKPAEVEKAEKAKPKIPRSGGEFGGTPGGNRQWTEADVLSASADEVSAAMAAGLLQNLGFGASKKH